MYDPSYLILDGGTSGRYPVRAEPFSKSKVVGYLVSGVAVVATADCGDWLKVKIHTIDKEEDPSSIIAKKPQRQEGSSSQSNKWGWCLRRYKEQEFLVSANGIVIDDVVEAMNFNAHYNIAKDAKKKKDSEDHKATPPPDELPPDSFHGKSSKASRFSPPLFEGKENSCNPPQQSQPGAKKAVAEVSPPLSSVSTGTSEGGHSPYDEKATFLRSNSIRLPPINSPTRPMDSLDSKKQKSSKSKSKKNKSDKGSSSTSGKDQILPSEPSSEKDPDTTVRPVSVWSELKDPSGHIYYYNAATKESKWEPPQWIQVIFYYYSRSLCVS